MPWTPTETRRLMLQMRAPWRRLRADRAVHRCVQGVDLRLPRSHMLPHYARVRPGYGQNLVALAARLGRRQDDPVAVLDIGANVGDSALQILAATRARILCVEADPYWVDYLVANTGRREEIGIESVLLLPDGAQVEGARAVRVNGTTRFSDDGDGGVAAQPAMTVGDLRARHPELAGLRLVKSDTDGFDTLLVPAVAEAWSDVRPVLFFEYDPGLTRVAGHDPEQVWTELDRLGYRTLAIWDNAGDPLGRIDVADAARLARTLEPMPVELGYHFWDVAACHEDDVAATEVLAELVPMDFSVRGTWR